MDALEIRQLVIEYSSGGYAVRPIDQLDLTVSSGELVLLLGASGCGKTTLLSSMASILTPTSGTIRVGDTEVTQLRGRALREYRRHGVGVVFQAFNLVPSLTTRENVEAPLRVAGEGRRRARARAEALLDELGLIDRASHRPGDLSGGQQQRVAFARALAFEPPLLLADEPTAHLDYVQVEVVLRTLRRLAEPGRAVVVATHDERLLPLADRVVQLSPRAATAAGPRQRLELGAGDVVFEQGERGELVYVVESGEVEIVRRRADGGEELVNVVGQGRWFGELAPLFGLQRSATARARTDGEVIAMSVQDFREHVRPEQLAEVLAEAQG